MFDILGWILIAVAVVFITLIIFHIESDKPVSYKFTIPSVILVSLCIGYGLHFLLSAWGF